MKTVLDPRAGWIANLAEDKLTGYVAGMVNTVSAGSLTADEGKLLRDLASQVKEIAELPEQQQKRDEWYRLCKLGKGKPLLLVFPEDSWLEVLEPKTMTIEDPFWSGYEWFLKHLIYRHEHIQDDFVIEPVLYVHKVVEFGGWGVEIPVHKSGEKGSYVWEAPIKEESDIEKLQFPSIRVDDEKSAQNLKSVQQVLGDILDVQEACILPGILTYDHAANFRGIEQLMMDMFDRPKWLHRLMDVISEGVMRQIDYLEQNGHLSLNNRGHYVDSGGIAYTHELPAGDYGGTVRLKDLWGFSVAQAAVGVGPEQHEEFIMPYDKKLLDRCGIVSYGCCEPYTTKFDMLKRTLGNLRRVSVSPWCDARRAAEGLQDKYIYSLKPNPALVADFDPDRVRADIREKLEVSKGCVVEVILKDTFTIRNDPKRLSTWTEIVNEEIDRIAQQS